MKKVILLVSIAIMFFGCQTKVDLNAPYKATTIVFGLLNPDDTKQYIKINKTWLGEGNNFDYAMIRDSSEYKEEDFNSKYIYEIIGNDTTRTFSLNDTTLTDRDENGLFYGPEYTAYYFKLPNSGNDGLNDEATYHLAIDFKNKDDVFAETNIIKAGIGNITQPPSAVSALKFSWAQVVQNNPLYGVYSFKWGTTENAKRYDLSLTINYIEYVWEDEGHTVLLDETEKEISWSMGSKIASDTEGGETIKHEVTWQSLYGFLASNLEENSKITRQIGYWDGEVGTQKVIVCDFNLDIANDELYTYLEVNSPVTGLIQERPQYTNITNGFGLFASKARQSVTRIGITDASAQVLVEGEITNGLNFCFPSPNLPAGSDFDCE